MRRPKALMSSLSSTPARPLPASSTDYYRAIAWSAGDRVARVQIADGSSGLPHDTEQIFERGTECAPGIRMQLAQDSRSSGQSVTRATQDTDLCSFSVQFDPTRSAEIVVPEIVVQGHGFHDVFTDIIGLGIAAKAGSLEGRHAVAPARVKAVEPGRLEQRDALHPDPARETVQSEISDQNGSCAFVWLERYGLPTSSGQGSKQNRILTDVRSDIEQK